MEFVDEDAFCDWSRSDAFRRAHRTDVGPPSIGASAIETYSAVTETTSG
jgi:heme-degrading monooxygenase HmoA